MHFLYNCASYLTAAVGDTHPSNLSLVLSLPEAPSILEWYHKAASDMVHLGVT